MQIENNERLHLAEPPISHASTPYSICSPPCGPQKTTHGLNDSSKPTKRCGTPAGTKRKSPGRNGTVSSAIWNRPALEDHACCAGCFMFGSFPARAYGAMHPFGKTRPGSRRPETRSKVMAAVRQRDTAPEMLVRRMLHGMGYRYRLHRRDLPGLPDLVLPTLSGPRVGCRVSLPVHPKMSKISSQDSHKSKNQGCHPA